MGKVEKEKHDMLLLWSRDYIAKTGEKYIPGEKFNSRYKWLFGEYPYWYSWGNFSRDHGVVAVLDKFQNFDS